MRNGAGEAERLKAAVDVAGRAVPVVVSVRPGARRISLRLPGGPPLVKVTVPRGVPARRGLDFARSRAAWIARRLAERPPPRPFAHGVRIPFRGREHAILHLPGRRGGVWAEGEGAAARICVTGAEEHLPRRLTDWLKTQARKDLLRACFHYSKVMELSFSRVSVRDQKSRWGSCSARGTLSFSWRLVLAPPFVADYLAAHEVAHLAEMNHSPRFWALVRAHCPHVDAAEDWLKRNGPGLHMWGVKG